jgi:hypothetical protein
MIRRVRALPRYGRQGGARPLFNPKSNKLT